MEYDRDKVDEMVLALLWLTAFEADDFGARAWKSHDWDALDRLHEKGYISDPESEAKSVVLSGGGVAAAVAGAVRAPFQMPASRNLGKDTIPSLIWSDVSTAALQFVFSRFASATRQTGLCGYKQQHEWQ